MNFSHTKLDISVWNFDYQIPSNRKLYTTLIQLACCYFKYIKVAQTKGSSVAAVVWIPRSFNFVCFGFESRPEVAVGGNKESLQINVRILPDTFWILR